MMAGRPAPELLGLIRTGAVTLPGNGILFVYLDVENKDQFNTKYWNAWAYAVNHYKFNGNTPFYPCLYCNPRSVTSKPCNVMAHAASTDQGFAIWSNQPEPTCASPGPPWAPHPCPIPYTELWQYGEGCNPQFLSHGQVDVDESNPGDNALSYMLFIP